jgi:hypothetical protein
VWCGKLVAVTGSSPIRSYYIGSERSKISTKFTAMENVMANSPMTEQDWVSEYLSTRGGKQPKTWQEVKKNLWDKAPTPFCQAACFMLIVLLKMEENFEGKTIENKEHKNYGKLIKSYPFNEARGRLYELFPHLAVISSKTNGDGVEKTGFHAFYEFSNLLSSLGVSNTRKGKAKGAKTYISRPDGGLDPEYVEFFSTIG